MNKSYFNSRLSTGMSDFVMFKQQSGFDYKAQAEHLRHFDCFCVQNKVESHILTSEFVDAYRATLSRYASNTRRNRMSILKKFSEYHAIFNKESFVIAKINIRVQKPQKAYIYSEKEITQILNLLREYPSRDKFRNSVYYTIGGILAFTGVRIHEVLNMRIKDWNPNNQTLFIKKGKFGKDRIIPVTPTVSIKIDNYLRLRMKYALNHSADYLFVNGRKNKICYLCFWTVFSAVLVIAGIDGKCQPFSRKPSIHALRYPNLNKIQTFSKQPRIINDLQNKRFGYFFTFSFYAHHKN